MCYSLLYLNLPQKNGFSLNPESPFKVCDVTFPVDHVFGFFSVDKEINPGIFFWVKKILIFFLFSRIFIFWYSYVNLLFFSQTTLSLLIFSSPELKAQDEPL